MKKTTQILLIGGIILTAATLAFAWNGSHNGRGYGNHMGGGYHSGSSGHMNNGYHMGNMHGAYNVTGLTDQDVKALNQERQKFFNETRELRKETFNTKMELEDEMNSGTTDKQTVKKLRSRITELHNQLRNIHSDYPMMNEMRSQGYGRHMMRGAGYNGNGYCW